MAGPGSSAVSSSRRVSRQEGSRPTIGTPRSTKGESVASEALRLGPRLVDEAGREEGAAAAGRAVAVAGPRGGDAVAGGAQHAQGGAGVLGLEPGGEGVGEEDDLGLAVGRAFGRRPRRGRRGRGASAGSGRCALKPSRRSLARCQAGDAVAQVGEEGQARGPGRVARQVGDQAVAGREAVALAVAVEELDLHPRHVDAGRAFAAAALAGDAELHGLAHGVGGQRVGAELAGERQAQRVGAAAGDVLLVAGGAEGGAHDARRRPSGRRRCRCTSRRRRRGRPRRDQSRTVSSGSGR